MKKVRLARASPVSETWQPMARVSQPGPKEVWASDLYEATVRRDPDGVVTCLAVRRKDRQPVHDWHHLQMVKNDIAGTAAEAIELYPATSRLMDREHTYWLWAFPPLRLSAAAAEAWLQKVRREFYDL